MDVESQVQGTERTVERDLTLQVVPLEPTSAPPSWRPEGTDFAFLAVGVSRTSLTREDGDSGTGSWLDSRAPSRANSAKPFPDPRRALVASAPNRGVGVEPS